MITSEIPQLSHENTGDNPEQHLQYQLQQCLSRLFGINKLVLTQAKFDQKGLKYFNTLPLELTFDSDEDYVFLVED